MAHPVRRTPVRCTLGRYMPVRCIAMRRTPIRCTPMGYMSMRFTPVRYAPTILMNSRHYSEMLFRFHLKGTKCGVTLLRPGTFNRYPRSMRYCSMSIKFTPIQACELHAHET